MGTERADARKLEQMKNELTILKAQVWTLKRVLENTVEIAELLQKQPDVIFTYTWLLGERKISAKAVAEKIDKALPQLVKIVALKIAERVKLNREIKELEERT